MHPSSPRTPKLATATMKLQDIEAKLFIAKAAEMDGRYDDAARILFSLAQCGVEFDPEKRLLLRFVYRGAVQIHQCDYRILEAESAKFDSAGVEESIMGVQEDQRRVLQKLREIIDSGLKSLDILLEGESIKSGQDIDAYVFYNTLKADSYRWIAEVLDGSERETMVSHGLQTFELTKGSAHKLSPTSATRLYYSLNHATFHHELLQNTQEAILIAQEAYDAANNDCISGGASNLDQMAKLVMELLYSSILEWKSPQGLEGS